MDFKLGARLAHRCCLPASTDKKEPHGGRAALKIGWLLPGFAPGPLELTRQPAYVQAVNRRSQNYIGTPSKPDTANMRKRSTWTGAGLMRTERVVHGSDREGLASMAHDARGTSAQTGGSGSGSHLQKCSVPSPSGERRRLVELGSRGGSGACAQLHAGVTVRPCFQRLTCGVGAEPRLLARKLCARMAQERRSETGAYLSSRRKREME